jgi:programmed cell death protein 5
MVKPEKAAGVENILLQMAQTGQLRDKVSEQQLIDLLEQLTGSQSGSSDSPATTGPKITRLSRRYDDDDDDYYGI